MAKNTDVTGVIMCLLVECYRLDSGSSVWKCPFLLGVMVLDLFHSKHDLHLYTTYYDVFTPFSCLAKGSEHQDKHLHIHFARVK